MNTHRISVLLKGVIGIMFSAAISTAAWACPASPNYSVDFSSDQSCLAPNFNAAFVSSGGGYVLRLTPAATNQVGSVWFNSAQPLQNGFTTTFQLKMSGGSVPPADGIAFVIQNAPTPLSAIGYTGGNGGALGYSDQDASLDPSAGEGIANSVAIEFDSFQNLWDPATNHVAVQSCGTGRNTSHHAQLCSATGPNSTLAGPVITTNFADGVAHRVTVSYKPGNLHVILDGTDLFPSGVPVNLSTIGLNTGGTAFVGFTGATGALDSNQDILSWTFTPQAQSGVVTTAGFTNFSFQNNKYNYKAQLNSGSPTTASVLPIFLNQSAFAVQAAANFPSAFCFEYDLSPEHPNSCVEFELTCPQSSGGTCGSNGSGFDAELGTNYDLPSTFDPTLINRPGWLKGEGPDPLHPCQGVVFATNQIDSFSLSRVDPFTKGGSGGTGSCWIATYNTDGVKKFVGFDQPVGPTDSGNLNIAKAGQAIPLKFQVTLDGSPIVTLTMPPVSIVSAPVNCAALDVESTDTLPVTSTSSTGLQNLGGGSYLYTWQTQKIWAGTCRILKLDLGADGDHFVHTALFKFK
jgi:hypothetical protein